MLRCAPRERFIEGARARGVAEGVAVRVFDGIQGFSGFGFPVARRRIRAARVPVDLAAGPVRPEFLSSLLNEQPMGFYPPDALVHEAQRRGIDMLGPDVNRSGVECATEDGAVRIGLAYVTGLREEDARRVVEERDRGACTATSRISRPDRAWAAMRSHGWVGLGRASRWRALVGPRCGGWARRTGAGAEDGVQPLAEHAGGAHAARPDALEQVVADYASAGMTLGEHPMALLRRDLAEGVASSLELGRRRDRSPIEVAGMVVARQRSAARAAWFSCCSRTRWGPST